MPSGKRALIATLHTVCAYLACHIACVHALVGYQLARVVHQCTSLLAVLKPAILEDGHIHLAYILDALCLAHAGHKRYSGLLAQRLAQGIGRGVQLALYGIGVVAPLALLDSGHGHNHRGHRQECLQVCLCVEHGAFPLVHGLVVFCIALVVLALGLEDTSRQVHVACENRVLQVVYHLLCVLSEEAAYVRLLAELGHQGSLLLR